MPLSVMHVGSFAANVGDNLALDHVQYHLASALLPYRSCTTIDFHLLDLSSTFLSGDNSEDVALDVFVRLRRELNVSLLVFGGGGLVQPARQKLGTGWVLPLNQYVIDRLQGLPYIAYGVGVNLFRKMLPAPLPIIGSHAMLTEPAFSESERQSMRATIVNALSFSVRNDGSYAEMLRLFPNDEEVRAKLWEVADPGMILPAARHELVRTMSLRPHQQPTSSLPVGRVALQLAWNSNPSINKGRLGQSDVDALAHFAATAHTSFLPHTPSKDFTLQALIKQTALRIGFKSGDIGANVVPSAWFQAHLAFDKHSTLLASLYNASLDSESHFDAVVAMRGHGLYLCVALNIPCIALSTQDKVAGFAHICGLDNYLVDVAEDRKWAQNLLDKLSRLQSHKQYRYEWYTKRDACLNHWSAVAQRYHGELRARFNARLTDHEGYSGAPKQETQGEQALARACGFEAMRRRARQSTLLKSPGRLPSGLKDALAQLQGVAESQWRVGMRDRNGRIDPILGSIRSDPAALEYYAEAASDRSVRTICEVGYNWGASALVWLHSNPSARVYSFDLAERAYTNATLAWLNQQYGGRLELIRGNSTQTIRAFTDAARRTQLSCDLVLVDGDHARAAIIISGHRVEPRP